MATKQNSKYFGKLHKHNYLMLIYAWIGLFMLFYFSQDPGSYPYNFVSIQSVAMFMWTAMLWWVMHEVKKGTGTEKVPPNIIYTFVLTLTIVITTMRSVLTYIDYSSFAPMTVIYTLHALAVVLYIALVLRGMIPFGHGKVSQTEK